MSYGCLSLTRGTAQLGESRDGTDRGAQPRGGAAPLALDRIQPLTLVGQGRRRRRRRRRGPRRRQRGKKRETIAGGPIRLTHAQVILFTDELADFLHSGLQLEPALQLMENREERSPVKAVAGLSAAKKCATAPAFPRRSNRLARISASFTAISSRRAKSAARSPRCSGGSRPISSPCRICASRIKLALIYPACLVGFGTVAMVVFMTVLVPQMTKLLAKTGTVMPLPTYILVQLGTFSRTLRLMIAGDHRRILVIVFMAYVRQPAKRAVGGMKPS